jgi:hypothetical protein
MLRRTTVALALASLAIAAPSAFAKSHWNSQMKSATSTASRSAGGCTIKSGWHHGSLDVSCARGHRATLTYAFPLGRDGIQGKPWCSVMGWFDPSKVNRSWKVSGTTLRISVTVSDAPAFLSSVSVGYYTHSHH